MKFQLHTLQCCQLPKPKLPDHREHLTVVFIKHSRPAILVNVQSRRLVGTGLLSPVDSSTPFVSCRVRRVSSSSSTRHLLQGGIGVCAICPKQAWQEDALLIVNNFVEVFSFRVHFTSIQTRHYGMHLHRCMIHVLPSLSTDSRPPEGGQQQARGYTAAVGRVLVQSPCGV